MTGEFMTDDERAKALLRSDYHTTYDRLADPPSASENRPEGEVPADGDHLVVQQQSHDSPRIRASYAAYFDDSRKRGI